MFLTLLKIFCVASILSLKLTDGATNTMDNVLDFFPSTNGDGLNLNWAHAVNSIMELDERLNDETMMIETDIILRGIGTENQTTIPVHAHPPLTDSDLTLANFLNMTTQHPDKGMKLDFKYLEALEPSMQLLLDHESELKAPLWLNADIVIGPNSPRDPIEPQPFIDTANRYFNQTTLSLGFTTSWDPQAPDNLYTWTMIFDNLYYSYPLHPQPVTFPVRAVWCNTSWPKFTWLLGLRETFSVTIWSSSADDVDVMGLVDLRHNGDTRRIFYDLPDEQKTAFLNALEDPSKTPSPPLDTSWDRDQWVAFENKQGRNFAFFSTEGLGISGNALRAAVIHSKKQHVPVHDDVNMIVSGKIQFVNRYNSSADTSFDIYIRSSSLLEDTEVRENILLGTECPSGLQISVSSNGSVVVNGTWFNGALPPAECMTFRINDKLDGGVDISIVVKTCSDAISPDPNEEKNMLIIIPSGQYETRENYVILTKTGGGKDVIVEELTIEGSLDPTEPTEPTEPNETTESKSYRQCSHWLGAYILTIAGLTTLLAW